MHNEVWGCAEILPFRAARLYEKNAHEDRVSRGGAQRLLTQFFIPDRARHPFAVNNARLSI